jgi:hypothetical protein
LAEFISESSRLLAEGEARFLTVMGMGCVFLALVSLTFFMGSMEGVMSLPEKTLALIKRTARGATGPSPSAQEAGNGQREQAGPSSSLESREPATSDTDQGRERSNEAIAAAIAVGLSLHLQEAGRGRSMAPPSQGSVTSHWKIAGRLHQLRRFSNVARR